MVDYQYKGPVLFIDDEMHIRLSAKQTLELAGFDVVCLESAEDALKQLEQGWPGIVISDIKMPSMDGIMFMEKAHEIDKDIPIILITGHGDVTMAVQAMRDGAYDFIEKPFPSELLTDVAGRAMEKLALIRENKELRAKLKNQSGIAENLLGKSQPIEQLRKLIGNIANTDTDVLIMGETGTGKEMVARCLHENSSRHNAHFVAVNCGAMPETIFESELFGYEPGAFPNNPNRRIGKIEYSSGGTLFLDEIETLPMSMQVKLLRVLQERSIERLGSNTVIPLNLRILAATKTDLLSEVQKGNFREDLYYRLSVVVVSTPPLRKWKEDIPLLFQHFAEEASTRFSRDCPAIREGQTQSLITHNWPGNVRELKNAAERYVLNDGQSPLAQTQEPLEEENQSLAHKVEAFEKGLIMQALEQSNGSIKEAMELLDIPRKTLSDKCKKYEIDKADFQQK
ncbi:C4-dicarboxylate transport transcriptional regulatory protein DctD [Candidatus Terasakiella magnetica]|uniref:C4-dicarboxylate transport transcriptional regulatory protein DctD n=1 Tax=Candidatus Terasakiella magnetica TaxID=1867952 RepID=A0A1C3RI42_9PROT|nr:sigma-54 dependent transcriptional regulator [Candidatus Terasakiella magnetica]SCA56959.1 C4-dicarboxylate transport transcriptional regulatory protein DctD [Candidatus Terasakiella magnetica]